MNYKNKNIRFSLCFDQGNSSTKAGVFLNEELIEVKLLKNSDLTEFEMLVKYYPNSLCIFSSVITTNSEIIKIIRKSASVFIELSEKTPVPVINQYQTPETLGKDRLAGIIGAKSIFPGRDILVIDAGTAITYDFIDSNGIYYGGNIAPGIDMRFKSLNHFTQKLPLVEASLDSPFIGVDTKSAINSGVIYGVEFEINGYINTLKIKYPELLTFLTGGSAFFFEEKYKNAIFVEKNLVLIGLNRILIYNVQN